METIIYFSSIFIGVMSGLIIGSIPGLTATMAIALLIPFTFKLPAVPGLLLLLGVYVGGVFGGSVAAILVGIPGTPAATATVLDGYPMGKKGQAGKAIGIAGISSFIGGTISVFILYFVARPLATLSLHFGSPEVASLAFLGLTMSSSLSAKNRLKGIMAAVIGLIISTIGIDPVMGYPRFTYGQFSLFDGIQYIPAMIGFFGFAEILNQLNLKSLNKKIMQVDKVLPSWNEIKSIIPISIRGGILGSLIGTLPGAGANIAAFFSYDITQKLAKKKKKEFGTGIIEGVSAAESGNNGVTGGALVPLLTFGIPGDAVAAVLLGALLMHGLRPGLSLFQDNWATVQLLLLGLLIANFVMLIAGLGLARIYSKVLTLPTSILLAIITSFCFLGAYSMRNNLFDVLVMLIIGIIGFLLKKAEFPMVSLVLGIILGPMLEENFNRTVSITRGDFSIFLTRPISLVLIIIAILTFSWPWINDIYQNLKNTD
jgi:putative tricarboxylic transport membrane protein